MRTGYDVFPSPIGLLYIVADEHGVKKIAMTQEEWGEYTERHGEPPRDEALCRDAVRELKEYFAGARRQFTVPVSLEGTEFNQKVWAELLAIPYGVTRTYGDIARAIGRPKACRAVGQANRANPVPIIVPCHRVLGKNGELTGYMGTRGLSIKEFLLALEQKA